jgi:hypothetical protein
MERRGKGSGVPKNDKSKNVKRCFDMKSSVRNDPSKLWIDVTIWICSLCIRITSFGDDISLQLKNVK